MLRIHLKKKLEKYGIYFGKKKITKLYHNDNIEAEIQKNCRASKNNHEKVLDNEGSVTHPRKTLILSILTAAVRWICCAIMDLAAN